MTTRVGKLTLSTPFLVASGTFGYGMELAPAVDFTAIGGIVTKTITLQPRSGNPNPRIAELPSGMLNSIGLQNEGVEDFIGSKLSYLKALPCKIIVSVGGQTVEEFARLAEKLEPCQEVSALELNISCPNIKFKAKECLHFGQDPSMTSSVVQSVKRVSSKPIWVKLSPNVTDATTIAQAAEEAGADVLVVANTYFGIKIDIKKRSSAIASTVGGVSGPCIRALTLYHCYRVLKGTSLPVIGVGGVETLEDVLEYLILGARAVQLGTINFIKPFAAQELMKALKEWMEKEQINSLDEVIGTFAEGTVSGYA